ncbi:MAG: hypothetical protein D6791_01385 [Chloroflexi bacterium]|nr:MAG: hypothetical protein D6791_01385 [Chloroflexota bacterium]
MVATVDDAEEGMLSPEHNTTAKPKIMYDVTYEEWLAFQQKPPISKDDVLDMHIFLKDFNGDFVQLFEGEKDTEETLK